MVKRQTIALLAAEEEVPLVLTARQQALVDAVANRMLQRNAIPYRLSANRARRPGRGPDRAEAADRDGQNAR
ncbi:PTS system cellobiose/salicin/arbutin-specific transporter subunit IIBC [Klebsiella pneumoniae]|uniref:PTS system cellobiose/salicin/arbutin-specific transporter subunit IIBC n=1 Tax=Klebsiella pneumoniae TaxID=573 RepID=A0A378B4J4_KLEPN|nr:PTS system cellobiose/salicin/arbutin-specific transporter subunit IIBC [Klebsiella pneumoniae]